MSAKTNVEFRNNTLTCYYRHVLRRPISVIVDTCAERVRGCVLLRNHFRVIERSRGREERA